MSLLATRMQNMRINSPLDKWEFRTSQWGALDFVMQDTDSPSSIISDELKQRAMSSIGNTIQTPVLENQDVTIGSSRSVTIADSENDSALATFTFATYTFGFTVVPAMFSNNEISIQKDFETKMRKYILKLADTLDTAALTALEAAKTQVVADLLGKYSLTSNVLVSPLANQDEVVGDISVIMRGNDFFDMLHLIGSLSLESHVNNRLLEKGQFNTENKTYQWADKAFHWTPRLTNAAGQKATGIAVVEGSTGMLTRFERESVLRTEAANNWKWDIETLPILNIPVGTYYYESVGDFNAIGGAATADLDRAKKEHYGFAVDIAFVTAHNSDAANLASPIMKFAIATS